MTKPLRPRRVAIIGLGLAVAPHAKSLADLGAEGIEVAWAFSRSEERRRAFATRFPFPVTGDLARITGDPSISAVGVLTPPNTHLELCAHLAAAGKHILLEKPVEATTARSEELVARCRAHGVRLGLVLQHRFKPAAERLSQAIGDGRLGDIVGASARILLWRPQSYYDQPGRGTRARDGGGVLLTQGIHTLDLLLSLVGPPVEVRALSATTKVHRMETEDLACAAVRYGSGALGVIEATTAAYPGAPERIDLIGTKGTAGLIGTALTVATHDGALEAFEGDASPGGAGADPMAFPHDYHLALWRNFLAALDEGREPRVSGEEALMVHRFIDALLAG